MGDKIISENQEADDEIKIIFLYIYLFYWKLWKI